MAEGLLVSLDALLNTSDLSSLVGSQSVELNGIIASVQQLIDGPSEFANLQGLIEAVPLPPGLEGIGNLSAELSSFSVPTDFSGPLRHIMTPLSNLTGSISGGTTVQVAALFDLIREIIRLTTGRIFGGPSGMPDGEGLEIPELPDIEELRSFIAEANTMLDELGPRLDAARILELLAQGSTAFSKPLHRFPNIPLIDETMEALKTVTLWQAMNGDQLNAHLAKTVKMAAKLIAMPRNRVAVPYLEAAQIVIAGPETLDTASSNLVQLFNGLRPKILEGNAKPNLSELRQVEAIAQQLNQLANAMDLETSLLAHSGNLSRELTRALLQVVRALQPAYDMTPIAERVQGLIDGLPPAPSNLFEDVIARINEFDLAAISGVLRDVRDAVQSAVDEINGVKETVRAELEAVLAPVATGLDNALNVVGFNEITNALQDLPTDIENFVNNDVMPVVEPVRQGIESAIDTVSSAATTFNPQVLIAPISDAVNQVVELLDSPDVRAVFAELDQVLSNVIETLEKFDLAAAADESIAIMQEIEDKVSGIDPSLIPDSLKPTIEQAVRVVTDIDFTGDVAEPVVAAIVTALEEGPEMILGELEEGFDELRARLQQFRPSQVIGDQLDQPFQELVNTLNQFKPSDLLNELQDTLNSLASRINVLDVDGVVDPLIEVHQSVSSQVQALQPSVLLQPIEDAISEAVEEVYEVTRVDTIFDGVNDILELVQSWTGLLADMRDLLARAAELFNQPGDATAQVEAIVEAAIAKLDAVELGRLEAAFEAASAAVQQIERDAITGELARALQNAAQRGPQVFQAQGIEQIRLLVNAFPLEALRAHQAVPARARLATALESISNDIQRLQVAANPWQEISVQLADTAGSLQEALLDYYNVMRLNGGGVLAQFRNPPQTNEALKDTVRSALTDGLSSPLTTVVMGLQAFSPYIELLAQGISDILEAAHAKIDAIVGEEGLGGALGAAEEAAQLLRDIDLDPITDPLDDVYGRIRTAVDQLDPEPLRATLQVAQDAIGGLLQLSTLIDQAQIDTLDQTYASTVATIGSLAPSELISSTLDPVYEDLLADFLPVLDLPARLRELSETAGRKLSEDAMRELARIEVAFDEMLRAIPLSTGTRSVEASVSVGVG